MDINQVCEMCRCAKENPDHLFKRCKKVRHIWDRFFPKLIEFLVLCRPDIEMGDWWEIIYKHHNKEEAKRIRITFWTIWSFRNQVAVSKEIHDERHLILNVKRNLEDQRKRTLPATSEFRLESLRNHEQ